MALTVVILAAGEGRRMKSAQPKVLASLAGTALIDHVIIRARNLDPDQIRVVVGHGADAVRAHLPEGVESVTQPDQRGTGDAVACALADVPDDHIVLVLYGDVPLVRPQTMHGLVATAEHDACAVLTVELDNPHGYGRMIRDSDGHISRIVEERDATAAERAICEVNTGLLAMRAGPLRAAIAQLDTQNAQGEYYLTDVIGIVRAEDGIVAATQPESTWEVAGVNDRRQLAALERTWQREIADALMQQGVTLRDPDRLDVRGNLTAGSDVVIDVNCVFEGDVDLAHEVEIGAGCWLRNCRLGSGTRVLPNSIIDGAIVDGHCQVGPFARIRPGTEMAQGARVGNFVEIKQSRIGPGSKINHLAYVGDTEIGQDANIGAGVITCNYDGQHKHRTVIGDRAFIGSDTQLVAPVDVGADATIGAGSTITRDAPAGQLTLSRSRQQTLRSWKRPAERTGDDE